MRANRMSTKPNFPSSTYKTTTGLVGLAVDTNARNTILQLTDTCLKSVQRAPAHSGYRIKVEEWMHFIDKSVKMTDDIKAIEDYIDLGQIEEVIEMVKDEIELSEAYIENKGWELCDEAESHATEWYEFKNEDLHFQGLTDDVEQQNKHI